MAYETKSSCWVLIVLLDVVLKLSMLGQYSANGEPRVPCFYIFGDSLVDNGNNNPLPTAAKVNYRPYGIDFPDGPTGRFCNGRTSVDFLGELLGFNRSSPPFATAKLTGDVMIGVNYASGSAGIRTESGKQFGLNINLDRQLLNHRFTITRLSKVLGSMVSAKNYLNKCLYYVGMGSNDYLNNYFLPNLYPTSRLYTPEQYAEVLIDQYGHQIKTLYGLGARKVALIGLGTLGCVPYVNSPNGNSGTTGSPCVDPINNAVQLFNARLKSLVDQLNSKSSDAKFIYINSYGIASGDPTSVGFRVVNASCCPTRGDGLCIRNVNPCGNRTEYVFWDAFHPTETANRFTASRSYTAFDPSDAYPYDISHLISM